jgi:hypothetical protein
MKNYLKLKIINKLSVLDFLVLLFVIIFGIITVFNILREKKTVYVYTMNTFENWQEDPYPPLYWISNSVKKGDVAYDSTGKQIAEIISVDNTEWGSQRRYSRLKLKVNTLYDRRTRQYRLADQILQVGNTLLLNIGNSKYEGVISYIGETPTPPGYQFQYLELKMKAFNVAPWLAETYDETFVVQNTEGIEIFRILDSESVPAEKSVETDRGSIVRSKDPYYKDVYLTAKVRVRCQEGICYYNETIPVKIGYWMWTQSKTSILEGSTRILEIKGLNNEATE